MKKITKFLMTSVLLLTGAYGINNFNETKEVEAATTFVEGDKLYLNAGGSGLWDQADAWFAAHLFNAADDSKCYDIAMTDVEAHEGYYELTFTEDILAKEIDSVIFIRQDPSKTMKDDIWTNWNQTETYALPTDGNNLFTVTKWHVDDDDSKGSEGAWSKYIFNPTNIFQAVQTVDETDGTFTNAAKFVGALPKGTQASKNSDDEYNVGFRFEFVRTWEETVTTTEEVVVPNTLYLKPNANWKVDNARFAVYTWDGGEQWFDMTYDSTLDLYKTVIPEGIVNVILCRMNPNTTANNWTNKWNQTSDLTFNSRTTLNTYAVKEDTWDKGGGTWSLTKEETSAGSVVTKSEQKVGYYTCANLTSVRGFDSSVVPYEVEVYFAVVITDIPSEFNGGTVDVTPAYQDLNGETQYGETARYTITIGATGVTLA